MSALFRIIYAAHANGTHHKLALDALGYLQQREAEDWRRVFLKHVSLFLEGSKAPDKSFKDFKNHVLHVGDNYWGGAPEKVEAWYGHTVTALKEARWADAAYAAGVLSHYYTDPVHPFHTGQTEAENSIHRAVEWSINRSYDNLRALGLKRFPELTVSVPEGENWLREYVCDGAEFSHRYYEKLIAHYDLKAGVITPEAGLDDLGREVVAELLIYAAQGYGRLLSHAIAEAGVAPPPVNLALDTMIASLNIPSKWIEKRLANAEDREIVRAIYDELQATGRVVNSLPEDDRVIRDLHAREVLAPRMEQRKKAREARIPNGDPGAVQRAKQVAKGKANPIAPAVLAGDTALERAVTRSVTQTKPIQPPPLPTTQMKPAPTVVALAPTPDAGARASAARERKVYLASGDTVERAPSIGPKMAERLAEFGIDTVQIFLEQTPADLADLLDDSRIEAGTIEDWQQQAQLVMDVPGLRGTHAQLLVGAGYRTAADVADADGVALAADVLKFAATSEGKRILRDGEPPDVARIKDWVAAANEALAA